ncbi:hypothetical protein PV10_00914 [Exophiala mesophila]|uniref:Uncharacterized protein n=1 Tax=Exophiala mesophila TaxID=212818 RepID=A0A0D1Y8Y7_EXOME|nr:uncharacterized protein PV10_00914 [Exophiala mesophila]KIV97126.1 hypothetical protein PV10_00914 [Exophiala mesophila]
MREDFNMLSAAEKAAEGKLQYSKALLVAYRRLIQKNLPLKMTIELQATAAFTILKLSRRIFEVGEAHLQAIISRLESDWSDVLNATQQQAGEPSFPLSFYDSEREQIEADAEAAYAGIQGMEEIKRRLGPLLPDKGAMQAQYYAEMKRLLREVKEELLHDLALDDESTQIFYR